MNHSSAFADGYGNVYSTGYGSYVKPRIETRAKLTDAELLVLPPFGYDLLSQEKFDKAFVGVVRRNRLEYLIYNVVAGGREQVRCKPVAPKKLNIFSPPKDMRREQWGGVRKPEVCKSLHNAFTPMPHAY